MNGEYEPKSTKRCQLRQISIGGETLNNTECHVGTIQILIRLHIFYQSLSSGSVLEGSFDSLWIQDYGKNFYMSRLLRILNVHNKKH